MTTTKMISGAVAGIALIAIGLLIGHTPLATPALAASGQTAGGPNSAPPVDAVTVIRDVRVFDGEAVIPSATVILAGDRIAQVVVPPTEIEMPAGARIIEGAGKTLLPGMIDAHTHSFDRNQIKAAVALGVTTQLDMFTAVPVMQSLRAEQEAGNAADRPDLYSAGTVVTAAGGHGTQYGMPIPTLDAPEDAPAFVDARLEEGSDYIKIIYEDGSSMNMTRPTLDEPTLRAAIEAAQARDALAVVHITAYESARRVLAMRPDGLVHIFANAQPAADFGRMFAASGAFMVPTLAVLENFNGSPGAQALVEDPLIGPRLFPEHVQNLELSFPAREGVSYSMDYAFAAVRLAHEAGAAILAGTDAPNPGTIHGASMHRELELLVAAGLTPVEALTAATAAPADAFGLQDRGRIAAGKRADVVLVNGDPTTDILRTRAVEAIWKEGRPWKLDLYIEQAAQLRAEAAGQ